MEANELRIGNYLNGYFNTNEGFEKQSFQISHLVISEIAESTHDYEPIPLTEEWLVKFGFDWIEEDRVWTLTVCPQGSFSITFTYQEDFSLALSESPQLIDEICPAIHLFNHVHQLQNLYFALTSEELQIKDHD